MIRKAEKKDIDGIIRLLYQVNQVHADGRPDLFKSGGIKYTPKDLKDLLADPQRPVYVFAEADEVLGYVFGIYQETVETTSLHGHKTMYIDDLCVEETRRGEHIGQQLYEHICNAAREKGCYQVTLHVWACNPGAEAFYRKLGMQTLHTTMEQLL